MCVCVRALKARAMTEVHIKVLAAESLKRDGLFTKMSVYSLLWIDPAMKQATRVHQKGGRSPHWNDELIFDLGEGVLIFPHSTITIQVSIEEQGSLIFLISYEGPEIVPSGLLRRLLCSVFAA